MPYEYLIFDLDGTISDPKQGILRSLNHALEHFNFETITDEQVGQLIGPPLDLIFARLTHTNDKSLIHSLVARYRERYADIGYSENKLYDGITETLQKLYDSKQCKLGLCTSKRVDFAEKILEMFDLSGLFSFLNGGDIGIHKWQQLKQLKGDGIINANSMMIGDRNVDLIAAHKNKLPSSAVLWGYGSLKELQHENPMCLFDRPEQLLKFLV